MSDPAQAWFLIGPTASGKNSAGVVLAEHLGAEVISLDSMKVFRQMDIGTAKPTLEMRARVAHHLVDLVDPSELFDVACYIDAVDQALAEIDRDCRPALFVGGTLLHLQAMLRGLFDGPPADQQLRERLIEEGGSLHDRLASVDPESAARLHPNDTKRLVRALEVFELTGEPLSKLQRERTRPHLGRPFRGIILARGRDDLYDRIDRRTAQMFEAGWVEEVRRIRGGCGFGPQSAEALGYRQIVAALDAGLDPDGTIKSIQHATHRLARKQTTWLRRFEDQLEILEVPRCWERESTAAGVIELAKRLEEAPPRVPGTGSWLKRPGGTSVEKWQE